MARSFIYIILHNQKYSHFLISLTSFPRFHVKSDTHIGPKTSLHPPQAERVDRYTLQSFASFESRRKKKTRGPEKRRFTDCQSLLISVSFHGPLVPVATALHMGSFPLAITQRHEFGRKYQVNYPNFSQVIVAHTLS